MGGIDDETPIDNVDEFILGTKLFNEFSTFKEIDNLPFSQREKERCKFAVRMLNSALKALNYDGNTLPLIIFTREIQGNSGIRVGGGFYRNYEHTGRSAIAIDISDSLPNIVFSQEKLNEFKTKSNYTDKFIGTWSLAFISLHELRHFYDNVNGDLPEGIELVEAVDDLYSEQEHERRATDFATAYILNNFRLLGAGGNNLYS